MERPFHEVLRDARKSSRYSRLCDFLVQVGMHKKSYTRYESGEQIPKASYLERILKYSGFSESVCSELRELHAEAVAEKSGVAVKRLPATLNVSELAAKIQREIEYELKRERLFVTKRTSHVCVRRIEMLLKDALRLT